MSKTQEEKRDRIIAAAVTAVAVLLILLFLFVGGMNYDRSMLAQTSTAEIEPPEEEMFLEPELLQNLGEPESVAHDDPAPAQKGKPEQAEVENVKKTERGDNPKPAPPVEKKVTQPKESPIKATEPMKTDEDKKKVTSKMANKFPGQNGAETGKTGSAGAGGTGVGISGSVTGRTFMGCPKPNVALQNKVVVEVRVTIDSSGRVIAATARSKQGKASPAILSACEQAARGARWNEDAKTPTAKGSLTFTITPK